jgi:hypothetical protein
MLEAMVYLISRTVPEDLQPAVVVLAFAELPVVWAEIIGRAEEEIIALLAEFYLTRDDVLQLSGLAGGAQRRLASSGPGHRLSKRGRVTTD